MLENMARNLKAFCEVRNLVEVRILVNWRGVSGEDVPTHALVFPNSGLFLFVLLSVFEEVLEEDNWEKEEVPYRAGEWKKEFSRAKITVSSLGEVFVY